MKQCKNVKGEHKKRLNGIRMCQFLSIERVLEAFIKRVLSVLCSGFYIEKKR